MEVPISSLSSQTRGGFYCGAKAPRELVRSNRVALT